MLRYDQLSRKLNLSDPYRILISSFQVGRPSNMPQAQPLVEEVLAEAALGTRVYLASIHPDIGEDDLKRYVESISRF